MNRQREDGQVPGYFSCGICGSPLRTFLRFFHVCPSHPLAGCYIGRESSR